MIEKLTDEIKQIESVETVAVISFKGNIWQSSGGDYSEEVLRKVGLYLLRMAAANDKRQQKLVLAEMHWLDRNLIARFSDGFLILVIFRVHDVVSHLRITLNVTAANLLEEKNFLKWLKKEKVALNVHLNKGQLDEQEVRLISKLV